MKREEILGILGLCQMRKGRGYKHSMTKSKLVSRQKSNEVFALYKFQVLVRAEGEPFENIVTDLKLLVKDCSYIENEKMVRDHNPNIHE